MTPLEEQVPNNPGMYIITDYERSLEYVGSSGDLNSRRWAHLSCLRRNKHNNKLLQELFNRCNQKLYMIYYVTESKDDAFDLEQQYLDDYLGTKRLCNIASDARLPMIGNSNMLGKRHSEETKAKISVVHKGKVVSEETRVKQSEAHKGNTYWLGKSHTEESRAKMSASQLGREVSEETRLKISQSRIGKPTRLGAKKTEEANRKVSEANRGNKYCLGRQYSEETIAKLKDIARQKYGLSVTVKDYVNGIVVIFGSIAEAAETIGVTKSLIKRTLKEASIRLKAGYAFQKANVNTIQQWPIYSQEEALESRRNYFNGY